MLHLLIWTLQEKKDFTERSFFVCLKHLYEHQILKVVSCAVLNSQMLLCWKLMNPADRVSIGTTKVTEWFYVKIEYTKHTYTIKKDNAENN